MWTLGIAVHALLVDEAKRKIFLIRRANTGWYDGYWTIPAGKLEQRERVSEGTKRELLEEAGVAAEEVDWHDPFVLHKHDSDYPDDNRVYFFFRCRRWSGEPYNAEPEKCDAVGWFAFDALPEDTIPPVRMAIEHLLGSGLRYAEWGFDGER